MPVPAADSVTGAFVALPANVMVPDAAPLAVGLNVSVKETLWPAARVNGREIPFMPNSGLVVATEETVTPAPLAVRVPVSLFVVPTVTLPKFALAGVTVSWPGLAPVPERAMLRFVTEPLAVRARLPETAPALDGVNVTLKMRLCPAFSVVGTLRPFIANPIPLMLALEI